MSERAKGCGLIGQHGDVSSPAAMLARTDLVFLCCLLGQCHNRGHADRQMVSTDKVSLAVLHNLPVLFQVLEFVLVCRGEIGAHGTVVAGDDDSAATRRVLLIVAVADLKTGLFVGILEDIGILVLADASKKDDRV